MLDMFKKISMTISIVLPFFIAPVTGKPLDASSDAPRTWVMMIAVKKHNIELFNNLRFTQLDALELRRVFNERSRIRSEFVELSDSSAQEFQPTIVNIKNEVRRFLTNPAVRPNDRVIIIYSGHGFLVNGEMELVAKDFDPKQNTEDGVRKSLVKNLRKCVAKTKLLVLDCCHAAGASRFSENSPDARSVANSFVDDEQLDDCVVLASSQEREVSQEWGSRKQGLFTFWLIRALEGGADYNRSGSLDCDEIHRYVSERVKTTIRAFPGEFQNRQTPVLISGKNAENTLEVLEIAPEETETVCRRIAEHFDIEIRLRKYDQVGIAEFALSTEQGEQLARANYPRLLVENVYRTLSALSLDTYKVLRNHQTARKLSQRGITVREIGRAEVMNRIKTELSGLISGTVRIRGPNLEIDCELIDSHGKRHGSPYTAVVPLSDQVLADLGYSFYTPDRPNQASTSTAVINQALKSTKFFLESSNFPFTVAINSVHLNPANHSVSNRTKKMITAVDGSEGRQDAQVQVAENEMIEILVNNNYDDDVAVACFVDGKNILGERRERIGRAQTFFLGKGKQLLLDRWIRNLQVNQPVFAAPSQRIQFKTVANLSDFRKEYADEIGLITIAIHQRRKRSDLVSRGDRISAGKHAVVQPVVLTRTDFEVGNLITTFHIKYSEK